MMQNLLWVIVLVLCAETAIGQSAPVSSEHPAKRTRTSREVPAELAQVAALMRIANPDIPRKGSRVVFASEASLNPLHLERWIVTIEHDPNPHDLSRVIESGPPCM